MASIAYVTDKNMIEFHRLNGNHTINFWKPSTSKKISSFHNGDLLFFLAKGTEKGVHKEKGLLGYGKLIKNNTLNFSQMWSKYGTMNGYPNKESLSEAIVRVTKNHKLPDALNCLLLEDVVFFQYPVYLSEIGMEISNKIESYIYIDKEDLSNTGKILEIADQYGVDMWSSLFHDDSKTSFTSDAQIQTIQNIHSMIKQNYYSTYDENRINRFIQSCLSEFSNAQRIRDTKTEFLSVESKQIKLYLPCIVNSNDFERKLQYVLGHYMMYQGYLKKSSYASEIKVVILFNQAIPQIIQEVLSVNQIAFEIKLIDVFD